MPPVGFEPTISAGERPQTYALDCAATGAGKWWTLLLNKLMFCVHLLFLRRAQLYVAFTEQANAISATNEIVHVRQLKVFYR